MSIFDALVWRAHSLPFVVLAAALLALVVTIMLMRGDLTIRAALASAAFLLFPWAAGTALILGLDAAPPLDVSSLVVLLSRVTIGSLGLAGPTLLFLILAMSGLLAQRRYLVYVFAALAVLSCLATWTTDLIIADAWQTSWRVWHPRAGILYPVHQGILFASIGTGALLGHRATRDRRDRTHQRYFLVIGVALALSAFDAPLFYGMGVYPFTVLPVLGAVLFTLYGLTWRDLLHARGRGIDWSAVWELALFAAMIPLVSVAAWAASSQGLGGGPLLAVLFLVPLYGTVQAITLVVRSYLESDAEPVLDSDAEQALEELGELVMEPESEAEIGELLAALLGRHSRLTDIALYLDDGSGTWRRVTPAEPSSPEVPGSIDVPSLLEAWLREQQRPVATRDLATRRVGRAREPLAELLRALAADVIVPLVERGTLVGAVCAALPGDSHGPDDRELLLLQEAARLAARALIYMALFREAMERIEMAKELEVAAASRVTREPGEQRHLYDLCEIIGYYHTARQVGGGWWTSYELDDGRVLVVMGDVIGHGVPSALVSATVAGACETVVRMRGAQVDVVELLNILGDAVRMVDAEERYAMRCFAAIFDEETVSFAGAGHPAPWVCRRRPDRGEHEDELHALEAHGSPLGAATQEIEADLVDAHASDIVVLCSEALSSATSPSGERYGAQRLPRFLRRHARAAGGRVCRAIIEDVLSHCGEEPVAEDMTLVVVRLENGRARQRAHTTGTGR